MSEKDNKRIDGNSILPGDGTSPDPDISFQYTDPYTPPADESSITRGLRRFLGLGKVQRKSPMRSQVRAGAGITGLLGFFGLFAVSSVFFLMESYFLAMLFLSIALLVYETGIDLIKILFSSFTIFFSSKHLTINASYLQETLRALSQSFNLRHSTSNEIEPPVQMGAVILLPDNPLSRDMQKLLDDAKDLEYAQYVAHSYYVDCHELYNYSNFNLDFVANAMPLFGLMGTVLGLIGMFEGLGANISVESLTPQFALALKTTLYGAVYSSVYKLIATRFEQRLKSLEYDYETFCGVLEVLVKNNNTIELVK